ncbi:MAG: MEDS domain-containing protein [Elusimicrobiota bacterium]
MQAPRNGKVSAVHLAGRPVGAVRHVCLFHRGAEERDSIILSFLKEGYEGGDKLLQILEEKERAAFLDGMAKAGIPAETMDKGQMVIAPVSETYLKGGDFNVAVMCDTLKAVAAARKAEGYPRARLTGRMEWALESRRHLEKLVEYESRVNMVLNSSNEDIAVCSYDLDRFNAGELIDIFRVHPAAIIGGVLQENAFYTPPEEFLKELRERRPAAAR